MLKYKLGDWVLFSDNCSDDGAIEVGQIVGVDTSPLSSNYLIYNKELTEGWGQMYPSIEELKIGFTTAVRNGDMTFIDDADFSKTTWINKEDIIRIAEVPDSKLARNLYKNQITGEETRNGQTFLVLGVK